MTPANQYRNLPRRRFSREFKREVVELLNEEAATVAEVARMYELHPNQLFRWRREYAQGTYGAVVAVKPSAPTLLPVVVEPENERTVPEVETKLTCAYAGNEPVATKLVPTVKIVLGKGQLQLNDVHPETLRLLIEALK